ncbi:CPNE1-like protein, partial [Mya arenaria]
DRSPNLHHHDFVGSVELSSLDLVDPEVDICTRCKTLRVPGSARGRGLISITSERIRECREKVSFHVGAHKLNKKDKLIGKKPDVYLEISRSIDNVTFHPIYRMETDKKTQHPRFPLNLNLSENLLNVEANFVFKSNTTGDWWVYLGVFCAVMVFKNESEKAYLIRKE